MVIRVMNGRRTRVVAVVVALAVSVVACAAQRDVVATSPADARGGSSEAETTLGVQGVLETRTVADLIDTATVSDIVDLPPTPDDSGVSGVDGVVVRHTQPYWDEAMLEGISGVLAVEGDCLYLTRPEWQERYPVVWPAGTSWDDEALTVVTPAGEPLPVGGTVSGGGGFGRSDLVEYHAGAVARDRVERCLDPADGQVAIVNNNASAIGAANN